MRVFLSYSSADKKLAARLRHRLEEEGLSFNDPDAKAQVGTSWRQQAEKAIRSSDAILLLLNSREKADEPQQLTWRLALEAVWADSSKRLIPILLQNAELPPFVRSGASEDTVQAIRIREPKDLDTAVQAILRVLGVAPPEVCKDLGRERISYTYTPRSPDIDNLPPISKSGKLPPPARYVLDIIEKFPAVTDEDQEQRRERLSAIKQYVEQLKH